MVSNSFRSSIFTFTADELLQQELIIYLILVVSFYDYVTGVLIVLVSTDVGSERTIGHSMLQQGIPVYATDSNYANGG